MEETLQLKSDFSRADFGGVLSDNDFSIKPVDLDYLQDDGTVFTAEGWTLTLPEYYDHVLGIMKRGGYGSRRELFQYSG